MQLFIKYLTVFLSSAVKFVFGPLEGLALELSWAETALLTASGMMLSVTVFTFFGNYLKTVLLRRFFQKRKLFKKSTRRNVRLWQKLGIYGVAFLTPILLTPIGGTVLAVSFGEKKYKIMLWMLASAIFWSVALTLIAFQATDWLQAP
jgi:hypothetical protein